MEKVMVSYSLEKPINPDLGDAWFDLNHKNPWMWCYMGDIWQRNRLNTNNQILSKLDAKDSAEWIFDNILNRNWNSAKELEEFLDEEA
jgi:hypothetical protein